MAGRRKKITPIIPYEDEEHAAVLEFCDIMHMPYFHVNNEMWTESWSQKAKAKKLGTKAGVPDIFIFIPVGRHIDESTAYQLVTIEMKRRKGSSTSAEQKEWGRIIEAASIPHAVCKGAQPAINFLRFAKQYYSKRWRADQAVLQSFKESMEATK